MFEPSLPQRVQVVGDVAVIIYSLLLLLSLSLYLLIMYINYQSLLLPILCGCMGGDANGPDQPTILSSAKVGVSCPIGGTGSHSSVAL